MAKSSALSKVIRFIASILLIGVGVLLSVAGYRLSSEAYHDNRLDRAMSPDWHPIAAEVTSVGVSFARTGRSGATHGFKAWFSYAYVTNGFMYEKTCDDDHFSFCYDYGSARSEALRVLRSTRVVILSDTPPEPFARTGGFLAKPAQGLSVTNTVYISRLNPDRASTRRYPYSEMIFGSWVFAFFCFFLALGSLIFGLCGLIWPEVMDGSSPVRNANYKTAAYYNANPEKRDLCGHATDGSLPALRSSHGSPHFWDAFDRFSKAIADNPVVIKTKPVYWDREGPGKPRKFGFKIVLKHPCLLRDGRSYDDLVASIQREFEGYTVTLDMPWLDDIPDPGSHC